MTELKSTIEAKAQQALRELYDLEADKPELQPTRKEFEGDLTLVIFPYLKSSRKGPEPTAQEIGEYLQKEVAEIAGFNVVKGFLNLSISDQFWLQQLDDIHQVIDSIPKATGESILVEYSSPNTNKPLHLGHIRNCLLGYSVAEMLKATGNEVIKAQIINDRGIHICKSMVAWQKFGNGETPESSGMKGDHLVGKYYVMYAEKEKEQLESLKVFVDRSLDNLGLDRAKSFHIKGNLTWLKLFLSDDESDQDFLGRLDWVFSQIDQNLSGLHNQSDERIAKFLKEYKERLKDLIIIEARQTLKKWEASDPEVMELWNKMNGWVYEGFEETYEKLGVDFDKNYYESETYLLGKKAVEEGLSKGMFYRKEDGSVWVDLSDEGLDDKLLLRADGTSVYMTQDIGTAIQRYEDFGITGMIYTVGNEQDYHFKVLFKILKMLGYEWAEHLYHLSYGMVDLPSGKMKSREGTVVDADDLIQQMRDTAKGISDELGKTEGMSEEEKESLYHMLGMGALKYYILRVDPRKRMLFNPEESIDFQGNTGPFIQYTHARICSLLRKAGDHNFSGDYRELTEVERNLIKQLVGYSTALQEAAAGHSPSVLANYIYDLVKAYNGLYQQLPILTDENPGAVAVRLQISKAVGKAVKNGMGLLGIEVPERM